MEHLELSEERTPWLLGRISRVPHVWDGDAAGPFDAVFRDVPRPRADDVRRMPICSLVRSAAGMGAPGSHRPRPAFYVDCQREPCAQPQERLHDETRQPTEEEPP